MGANAIDTYQGDTLEITCTVYDAAGAVFDLSGYAAAFTVKEHPEDTTAVLSKTTAGGGIVIAAPATGVMVITVDAGDTATMKGNYYYDIQITDLTNVYTVVFDNFIVDMDVT